MTAAVAAWLDAERPYDIVRDLLRPVPDDLDLLVAESDRPPGHQVHGRGLFE